MAGRLQVALTFSYNEDWIGGTYYVLNLINALKSLPAQTKPIITVFVHNEQDKKVVSKETQYKGISFHQVPQYDLFQRIWRRGWKTITKTVIHRAGKNEFDVIFPEPLGPFFQYLEPRLFWIPDFQYLFLPDLFSEKQLRSRKQLQNLIVNSRYPLVLSSKDSEDTFNRLNPGHNSTVYILPFAVTHPDISGINIEELRAIYDLPQNFFLCSNQFWAHKNHVVVLKALNELKKRGKKLKVVFTGREYDPRNPTYTQDLKKYLMEHQLEGYASFLGFIDRKEQLVLARESLAIIQPSLFEGWSTVVEDAKSLNQYVLVSDIPVHREQVKKNAIFFNPENEEHLAEKMVQLAETPPSIEPVDYKAQVRNFGGKFLEIVADMKSR